MLRRRSQSAKYHLCRHHWWSQSSILSQKIEYTFTWHEIQESAIGNLKDKGRDSSPWHHDIKKMIVVRCLEDSNPVVLQCRRASLPAPSMIRAFFFLLFFFSWGFRVIPVFPVSTRWIVGQSLKESLQDCALTKRVFQGLKISTGEPLRACQFLICLFIFVSVGLSWEEHSTKSEKSLLK